MKLSQKITELRKSHNWSQEELAYRLGVTRQSVGKWAKRRRPAGTGQGGADGGHFRRYYRLPA